MNWIDVNEKLPEVGIDSVYGSAWVLVSYVFDGKHYNTLGKYIKRLPRIGLMYIETS